MAYADPEAARPAMRESWRKYGKSEKGRIRGRRAEQKYYWANLKKRQAKARVNYALKKGVLVRQPCETCGNPQSHAHHHDYDRPLDVRWLCSVHHVALHHSE